MKKLIILASMLIGIMGFSQQTKKKIYKKKPVRKSVTKKASPPKESKEHDNIIDSMAVPSVDYTLDLKNDSVKIVQEQPAYEKTAEKLLTQKGYIKNRNSAFIRGAEIFIKGVYFSDEKLFFLLEIANRSNISYDIKNISFITAPKNQTSKSKDFLPIWNNTPETILKKSSKKIVFVFDKFSINDEKSLNIIVREKDGERLLKLEIPSKYILNSKYIN